MRLLIAEDDGRAARLLVSELAEFGHVSTVAVDGRTALQMASSERFDAVLLDVMMPYVDGINSRGCCGRAASRHRS